MSVTQFLTKNKELEQLFDQIYTNNTGSNIPQKLARFIEIVIQLTDEDEINKIEAGYIITDVLLKYDEESQFESVFDIASQLEIADAEFKSWSEKEINDEWNSLKSRFNEIKNL